MITYERARLEHVDYIAPRMRAEDVAELRAANPKARPWLALAGSVVLSGNEAVTALKDNFPIAIFGVYPQTLADDASPWLLGTDRVAEAAREMVHFGRRMTDYWLGEYPRLVNEVWVENTASIRWLERIGFTLCEPRPNPITGEMFQLFYKDRSAHV